MKKNHSNQLSECYIPVSVGELVDKLTILEIKLEEIDDKFKRMIITKEYYLLKNLFDSLKNEHSSLDNFKTKLYEINRDLWEIEDKIREKEALESFDNEFIQLARLVYLTNDQRFLVKNQINKEFYSYIQEQKSYRYLENDRLEIKSLSLNKL